MATNSLLYKTEFNVTDAITIHIPLVGQVLDDEDGYYSLISLFTSMPIDLVAELDEVGIDFTKINEYELFLYFMFPALVLKDTSLLFGDLDFSKFRLATKDGTDGTDGTENAVLLDTDSGIIIDRVVHMKIANALRKIQHLEKNTKRPANDEMKRYMIDRARKKRKRKNKQSTSSALEPLIISLVNTPEFKYDYKSVRNMTIYQFNESVRQVIRKIEYNNRMYGVYTGNIDVKSLSRDDLSWLAQSPRL